MKTITRRAALARGGQTALATVAGAVLATPMQAGAAPDDHRLVDLDRQWLDLKRELQDLGRACRSAEAMMPAWARPGPNTPSRRIVGNPEIDVDHPAFGLCHSTVFLLPSLDDIHRLNRMAEIIAQAFARAYPSHPVLDDERARARARIDHWHERQQAKKEWEHRVGLVDLWARSDDICDRMLDTERQILQTPARSEKGVGLKLRVFARAGDLTERVSTDPNIDLHGRIAISALEDMGRLGVA